jgi:hypothetical protein
MTTEIQQYKCPSCGQLLGKQEYLHACELFKKVLTDELQQQADQHAMEMKQKDEKFARELQSIVQVRMNEERTKSRQEMIVMERNYRQDIADMENRHKQELEGMKSQAEYSMDEKVRQVVTEKETKYRQIEEQYKLQLIRLEQYNKKLLVQIEEQTKRLEKIPGELGGTAGENGLLDELKKEFRTDDITGKKNGVAMADIVQYIVTERGERIQTPIVYDKKTSNKVTQADLEKARNYRAVHNTDHCIIVTTDIREANRYTEVRDGVLLVHPVAVIDVAKRIRSFLIETSKLAKILNGKVSKKDKLYQFLTSSEYNRDRQTRIEAKLRLDELQRKEEEYTRTLWNKRKGLISSWNELDSKLDGFVNDITQEDEDNEGDNPSI